MKILFEDQPYSPEILDNMGLGPFMFTGRDGVEAYMPYVGYVYSSKANDSIFILPKVFLFEGEGDAQFGEVAFGKFLPNAVLDITVEHNPLQSDGYDRILFGLSTWLYRAIDKYSVSHPKSEIIRRSGIQSVVSHTGERTQTLLDTVLSLLRFHKEHSSLFTYISIINKSGNNRIHWRKTINKSQPIIENNIPVYLEVQNKSKAINYDEELIVLFYSVLQYLRTRYFFSVHPPLNYELLKPQQVESLIESGRGTKMLRSIRRKYYKDELVSLWKLLFAFFEQSEQIRSGKVKEEALLARSFYHIFEEMVDNMISQDVFSDLKGNEDGKIIDHIYKEESLLGDGQIYFIGDSKYYLYNVELDKKSLYKQFTYARNIIQLNIDIVNKPEPERKASERDIISNVSYRDPLTEGYNLTPNFFIRGYIRADDFAEGSSSYGKDRLKPHPQIMPVNTHFGNRPFDRDTLIIQAYDINFLFVLASYVNNSGDDSLRQRIRSKFRNDIVRVFNNKFDFYHVTPLDNDLESFVKRHFREYLGNMFHTEGMSFIWFAFDKGQVPLHELVSIFSGEASVAVATLS